MIDCIFCRIVKKQIPSKIVYEDDKVLAFEDIAPQAPVHIVVISKKHIQDITQMADYSCLGDIFKTINKIAKQKKLASGFRAVVNYGKDAGLAVNHLHFHLLAGRALAWPPG